MHKEPINVILASDENYAQPMGTAIYSLLDNFISEEYVIKLWVLDGGISEESKRKLLAIGRKFETEINFEKISNSEFDNFPLVQYFSIVMYYRLLIPNLFKGKASKVIYLDCDTLVLGNIANLYKINVNNYYLAAVRDFVESSVLKLPCPFYKDIKKYFNSGVLLINVDKMNKDNFFKRSMDFIYEHSSQLLYPDQDMLNYLCIDAWYELEKGWNTQLDRSSGKIEPTPFVLHYTTGYKPWHAFYHNYYQKFYIKYLKEAWPGYTIKPVSFITILKQLLKHIPYSVPFVRFIKKNLHT